MNAPFILSPGLDPDAWRMLLAAKYFAEHHTYIASRLPGYPVPELVYSVTGANSPWVCIALTVFVSIIGFLAFYRILQTLGIKDRLLVTLAYALTPVVLINSVSTMDYMWAISLVLVSILMAVRRQTVLCGVFLGVAVGCRITSSLMLLPVGMLVYSTFQEKTQRTKQLSEFFISTVLTSLLCFAPVLQSYGFAFLRHSEGSTFSLLTLAKEVTVDTFGIIGTLGIPIALGLQAFLKNRRQGEGLHPEHVWKRVAWSVVGIYGFLFALLPLDAGYLIPIIPFLLILARLHLSRISFRIIAFSLLLSPFFISMDSKDRPWSAPSSPLSIQTKVSDRILAIDCLQGAFVLDILKRNAQQAYANIVLDWSRSQADSAIVIAGVWMPALTYLSNGTLSQQKEERIQVGRVAIVGLLDKEALSAIRSRGIQTYFITGQDLYNQDVYGVNPKNFESEELVHAK